MESLTPRSSTPPPSFGLLTPPSTGGFGKRETFAKPQESFNSSKRQSENHVHEREALVKFFDDYNEGTSVDTEDDSNVSQLTPDSSSITSNDESSTRASSSSALSHALDRFTLNKHDLLNLLVFDTTAPGAVGVFPFMKLPLSVRNGIYEHLLVVPAIICVRQKHTTFPDEKAFLYAERRELLPGIAYALTQAKIDGSKSRFSRFHNTNLDILRASREFFTEARSVMYSFNNFEIVKPSSELTPEPDYSIPLFPSGYQRLVTKLNIRIRTFYDLDWLLSGGYNVVKNYYRGLHTLALILQMDSATKGFGRQWSKKSTERWVAYTTRLRYNLAEDMFDSSKSKMAANIPSWINLRVLFSGESYASNYQAPADDVGLAATSSRKNEERKREELRRALTETLELFKKSSK